MRKTVPSYVPLWCKSNYSFLEGASDPEELVRQAAKLHLPAIAITDRDGVYGIVRAHMAAKEQGIHLIIGSEITIEDGNLSGTLILYARNRDGYRNLCMLISTGRLRSPKGLSKVSVKEVCAQSEELIVVLPARTLLGWLSDKNSTNPPEAARQILRELRDAFPTRLYIGISRHYTEDDLRAEEAARTLTNDRLDGRKTYDRRPRIPLVAFQEVLYHDPARRPLQDVLTCIRHTCTIYEAGDRLKPNHQHYLSATSDLFQRFKDDPSLIACTLDIARQCTFSLDEIVYRYPSEHLPEGYTTANWLKHLTYEGAHERYPDGVPEAVHLQIEKELSIIEDLDYCGYFLTMWEIVQFCRKRGILHQGRGSAANSAVCFCLGITAVDPVRMDLLFERFLSRERAEPPDIDLDIEHLRREEVIQHMYKKYGRSHAAMVANIVRYRRKSAIRDIGKVLGIAPTAVDRLSRLVSYRDGDLSAAIADAGLDPKSKTTSLLVKLVDEILDFPRHLSIHPGGFMLGSEPISHIVPVENATMPDRTVIQWDKYDIESMNLFKVDLLGLGALTHLDYCFRLLKKHEHADLSMAKIPPGDEKTFEMVTKSDTVGVFQLESRAQMAMLPRMKPVNYYDLVIEVSIVRPGPITGGMVHPYLRRRAKEEKIVYPHRDLVAVLGKTMGVPIFQEQVMKLVVVAAGYTPGQADQLRRDMAAWRRSGRIEMHHDRVVSGMTDHGIDPQFAEQVFHQIRGFGEYGFPESHAASFALIAYATAWMKCHHPAVFSCALLNAWPMGFYQPATIIEDAKRHGVQVRPVNVLASAWECTLEPDDESYAIRMGLRYVKGLGEGDWGKIRGMQQLFAATASMSSPQTVGSASRKLSAAASGSTPPVQSPSAALRRFVDTSQLDEGALRALAQSGAFDCFGVDRRDALWRTLGKIAVGRIPIGRIPATEACVPGTADTPDTAVFEETSPGFARLTMAETIAWDHKAVGHSTEGHPLEPYRVEFMRQGLPDAREVIATENGAIVSYAGLVICRQRPGTAHGVVFFTLEDESGFVNLIVHEKTFQQYRRILLTNPVLGVTGRVQSANTVVHILVESCWVPKLSEKPARLESRDFH